MEPRLPGWIPGSIYGEGVRRGVRPETLGRFWVIAWGFHWEFKGI